MSFSKKRVRSLKSSSRVATKPTAAIDENPRQTRAKTKEDTTAIDLTGDDDIDDDGVRKMGVKFSHEEPKVHYFDPHNGHVAQS
jgi:hypothetical protein